MFYHIKLIPIKLAHKSVDGTGRKDITREYFLPGNNGLEHEVCKTFFLHTLGYKNNKVVTVLLKSNPSSVITPHLDQRGKHTHTCHDRHRKRKYSTPH